MARDPRHKEDYFGPLRRLLTGVVLLILIAIFVVWRVDSPRVERFRSAVLDRFVPSLDWMMAPVTGTINLVTDFRSYQRLVEQNRDLRRELQTMKAWKEAALQLEQENAKLRDLNKVSLDPELTYITGIVLADSGSPFRQSVLLNVGARDGIVEGWAAMDGIGLVGRIAGVGQETSRVILLSDTSSAIPITIQPSGQKAILAGDNTLAPPLEFLEDPDQVRPGDRVISSGDGEVFPPDLLVGQVVLGSDRRLRVRLTADFERLEFLRVLRNQGRETIVETGELIESSMPSFEVMGPTPEDIENKETPDG